MYLPQKTRFNSTALVTGMLVQFVVLTALFVLAGKGLAWLFG